MQSVAVSCHSPASSPPASAPVRPLAPPSQPRPLPPPLLVSSLGRRPGAGVAPARVHRGQAYKGACADAKACSAVRTMSTFPLRVEQSPSPSVQHPFISTHLLSHPEFKNRKVASNIPQSLTYLETRETRPHSWTLMALPRALSRRGIFCEVSRQALGTLAKICPSLFLKMPTPSYHLSYVVITACVACGCVFNGKAKR